MKAANWTLDRLQWPFAACIFFLALLASAPLQSQEAARSTIAWDLEPVFDANYDSRIAHFGDSIQTQELLPECKRMLSDMRPLPKTLTLYAQYKSASSRTYIAGSRKKLGIYVISNGQCDAGIPEIALLQLYHNPQIPSDEPFLSDSEVLELFKDALIRYAKAFGGKKQFFHWFDALSEEVRRSCNDTPKMPCNWVGFKPVLKEELERFRKS